MKSVQLARMTMITLLWVASTTAAQNIHLDWALSPGLGVGNWDDASPFYKSESNTIADHTSVESTKGSALGIVFKQDIEKEWNLDLSNSLAIELDYLTPVNPNNSIQKLTVEWSHIEWMKFGYFSGGGGFGGIMKSSPGQRIIEEGDCENNGVCFEQDKHNTVREFSAGLALNSDMGIRYGSFGLGLRNATFFTFNGFFQLTRLHADLFI